MQALQKIGADGFIVKEAPENSHDKEFTKKSLENIYTSIDSCLSVKKLKVVNIKLEQLKNIIKNSSVLHKEKTFFNTTIQAFDSIIFDLLSNVRKDSKYLTYSYLQLYFNIEEYLRLESIFKGEEYCYVIDNDGNSYAVRNFSHMSDNKRMYETAIKFSNGNYKIKKTTENRSSVDTNFKMSSLLLIIYGFTSSGENLVNSSMNWSSIYKLRNELGHGENTEVQWENIEGIIDFMIFIYNTQNQKTIGTSGALAEVSDENKLKTATNFIVKKMKR
jgi:hypothetical protein